MSDEQRAKSSAVEAVPREEWVRLLDFAMSGEEFELTEDVLEQGRRRFRSPQKSSHRSSLGVERELAQDSRWRVRLYRGRVDRVMLLVIGAVALPLGALTAFGAVDVPLHTMLAITVALLGVLAVESTIQSGRAGHLEAQVFSRLMDVLDSLPIRLILGHKRVHKTQDAVVLGARYRLMCIEMTGSSDRTRRFTSEFVGYQRHVLDFADDPNHEVHLAVAGATGRNLQTALDLITTRAGRPGLESQHFLITNTFPMDLVIADDEAFIGFAGEGGDLSWGIYIQDGAMVQQLWATFKTQLDTNVNQIRIREIASQDGSSVADPDSLADIRRHVVKHEQHCCPGMVASA